MPLKGDLILNLTDLEVCSDIKEDKFEYAIYSCDVKNSVMPWQRRLVAVPTWWIPRFFARPVFVQFGVDRVALGQVFVWGFTLITIIPLVLHTVTFFICYQHYIIIVIVSGVKYYVIHCSLSRYESTYTLHYGVLCYFKQQLYIH